jgi:hypothetical protein
MKMARKAEAANNGRLTALFFLDIPGKCDAVG